MTVFGILAIYFIVINLTGFAMMGIDKRKAVKKLWRIPESTLFVIAIIGGSIGSIIHSVAQIHLPLPSKRWD